MSKFTKRLLQSIFSRGYKNRILNISEILSLGINFDDLDTDEIVEKKFVNRISSSCGCILDWRPNLEELKNSSRKFATPIELEIIESIPDRSWNTNQEIVTQIKEKLIDVGNERIPVLLESLGDFCHLIFVPENKLNHVESEAGGWLIDT